MLGYKLFRLMNVLDKRELPEMEKFLRSPFHNSSKECTQLFRQLCKFHPAMDSPKLTKEFLFARIYGKADFDDGKMRKLMTKLTGLLERFLAIRELDKSPEISNKLLIDSLGYRSDYGLFKAAIENRLNELESRPERGSDYFRELYQLYQAILYHNETSTNTVRHNYLQLYISNLERYFILAILQIVIQAVIRQRLTRYKAIIYFHEAADNLASGTELAQEPLISFFHQTSRLYFNPDADADFDKLKNTLFACYGQMSFDEQRMALKLLINYAIPFSNKGSLRHTRFIFELYRLGVEKGMLTIGESAVNTELFLNIHIVGLLAGEFEWTRDFTVEYGNQLPENEREIALQYCKASWYYHSGLNNNSLEELEKSLAAINLIPVRVSEKFDFRTRLLDLWVKYEIYRRDAESLDGVLASAKNFRRHLANNQTYSESKKLSINSFINHYSVLSRLVNNPDLENEMVEKALANLAADQQCILKNWLNEKLRELLKN